MIEADLVHLFSPMGGCRVFVFDVLNEIQMMDSLILKFIMEFPHKIRALEVFQRIGWWVRDLDETPKPARRGNRTGRKTSFAAINLLGFAEDEIYGLRKTFHTSFHVLRWRRYQYFPTESHRAPILSAPFYFFVAVTCQESLHCPRVRIMRGLRFVLWKAQTNSAPFYCCFYPMYAPCSSGHNLRVSLVMQ